MDYDESMPMLEGGEGEPMMDAPMDDEKKEGEGEAAVEKTCTCLAVLSSQDDDAQLFDKITSSTAF